MKLAFLLSFAVFQLQLTRPAGLDFLHRNSPTEQRYLIETMGGGVGLIDYNNDGRLDIFLVNSGKLESATKAPVNFARDEPAYWNRLYRQNQNGSFTDVTAASGLSRSGNRYGMGVAVGDYDNDGFADIYVTNFGGNLLYHNNGNGTFSDVTISSRVGATGWSVSAGFFDYDNDGMLDLFVSRYLNYDLAANILCGTPFRSYCRPDWYTGTSNLLYRNEGSGSFRNVSESSGLAKVIGKGMGVAFNDYDSDGFTDIFVANDLMDQFLFHNERDGTFKELGLNAGVALSDDGKPYSGMGAAFADYDNDGLPDIAVTNLALEKWALYRSEGEGTFSYASLTSGLAGATVRSSGWGIGIHDFDNDGWKDIFGAQSHVLDNVERINPSLRYLELPGLYRNVSGRFEKANLHDPPRVAGRGAAFGDIDNDGTIDVVVSTLGGAPLVLQGKPNQ
ncbi:MAG: VCBS repeat-containing protein, partial [Bryobacteraceae bacterium]|nr:VCBS repeat-containing protein [Bryobacteraceae bacterium]